MKGFVIAGTRSGSGKTSVALGLMAAFARRGVRVQPFKVGPDFIDPGHHSMAATPEFSSDNQGNQGKVSGQNLDSWMCSGETVRDIFQRYSNGADMAIVEGVMGLFDGYSAIDEAGSTAHLAKLLDLPVLLVVDTRSMARSVAALVSGFAGFDADLKIGGVILNMAAGQSHCEILEQAMAASLDIPVLGCLHRQEDISVPSRHLGLVTAIEEDPGRYGRLADWVEQGLDLDTFINSLPELPPEPAPLSVRPEPSLRVAVARDQAFSFYYDENIRLLEKAGAEIDYFSPIKDRKLPEDIQGIYIGGGYPELHAFDLSQNVSMRKGVRAFSEQGGPVYAECGGFMYLMESLVDPGGRRFNMSGVFPMRATMNKKRAALGYREICQTRKTVLGPAGTMARGHEFHYSCIADSMLDDQELKKVFPSYDVSSRKGSLEGSEGFCRNNTLGSYIHLHFGSNPELAANFVRACLEFANRNQH